MEKMYCISCKKSITNSEGAAKFNCPGCGNQPIIRCKHCREIASKYTCPGCNFTGPN